jgi:hypothetical protein
MPRKGTGSMSNTRMTILGAVASAIVALGAGPAAADVVNQLSLDVWFAGNEGPSGSVGSTAFVPGPTVPPVGSGSVELTVDATGRASFGTALYKGTRLDNITQLEYWRYVSSLAGAEAPTLQFDVDYGSADLNTTCQGRLVTYIPSPPALDTWTPVNALTGTWWSTGAPGNSDCTQVLANFPNAAMRNDPSAGGNLLFRLGGPVAGGGQVYVDDFTITASAVTTTWDFETGVAVNPTVVQAGFLVTIRAYGFQPNSTAKMFYYINGTSGKRALLCSATTTSTGAFICTVPLPSGSLAGPAGTHGILITGKSRVRYTTQIFTTP